jgi:hypothetical protein
MTTKPEFTKPFNLQHAKAGAPYCCRDGDQATVLKWDGRRFNEPLVGCIGDDDMPASWGCDGRYVPDEHGPRSRDLVMLPLGFIDGKPVWVGDHFITSGGLPCITTTASAGYFKGCCWPAPVPVYPTFDGSVDMLSIEYSKDMSYCNSLVRVANFALRHAIDAGQVVPDAEHSKLLAIIGAAYQVAGAHGASEAVLDVLSDPAAATAAQIDAMLPYETPFDRDAARDLAVAQAVFSGVIQFLKDDKRIDAVAYLERAFSINLPAIIAGVAK